MNGLPLSREMPMRTMALPRNAPRLFAVGVTVAALVLPAAVVHAATAPAAASAPTAGQVPASGAAPASTPVVASVADATARNGTASLSDSQKLAAMNALIPLLSAQATIEKLRADIAKSLSEQAKAGVPVPTSDLPALPNGMTGGTGIVVRPTANAQPAASPAPTPRASSGTTGDLHQVAQGHAGAMRLVTINVFDQKCLAIVDVSGRRIQVGEGDSVEGGWTVTAISDRTVTVARGRETLTLRM